MYDVICIGGGLAGLTASIHLRKKGFRILVIEKERYPHHKVCGEYLSYEVLPYLSDLGIGLPTDVEIDTLEFSTPKGRTFRVELPLGAIGISRFTLDHTLYQKAVSTGVEFTFDTVTSIDFNGKSFSIHTLLEEEFTSGFVIGSYGKRSGLDRSLNRSFMNARSPWLAVKAHYEYPGFPKNQVELHSFKGGYAGLSMIETEAVNFCYLVSYDQFQKVRDIDTFNRTLVAQNQRLHKFLSEARILFEKPLTIAQVSFAPKNPVEEHILMCGDTAGLIHPLCGNGMAMAIHSAKIASELILNQLSGKSPDRVALEREYTRLWKKTFGDRIRAGQYLQRLLLSPGITELLFDLVSRSPGTIRRIISKTHGNPLAL